MVLYRGLCQGDVGLIFAPFTELQARGGRGGVGLGYSHILAIQVCAAGKGMIFKPFSLV